MFLIFFFYLKTFQNATFICVDIFIKFHFHFYIFTKIPFTKIPFIVFNYINVIAIVCFIFLILFLAKDIRAFTMIK